MEISEIENEELTLLKAILPWKYRSVMRVSKDNWERRYEVKGFYPYTSFVHYSFEDPTVSNWEAKPNSWFDRTEDEYAWLAACCVWETWIKKVAIAYKSKFGKEISESALNDNKVVIEIYDKVEEKSYYLGYYDNEIRMGTSMGQYDPEYMEKELNIHFF